MEEKTIRGCKRCYWKVRQGRYSSCGRKLPDHIPTSAGLKYSFMLVEKYNNKSCHNFLSFPLVKERKGANIVTERKW